MIVKVMYYYLQGTKTTPHALINDGYMRISGNAFPVEQQGFFNQINEQVDIYSKKPANRTVVEISLSYVNASAKRAIVEFLSHLESLNNQGFKVDLKWWYEKDDDDVKELGEIYKSMFNINIELIGK